MDYSKKETWNTRYSRDQYVFEWYGNWRMIRDIFKDLVPSRRTSILHVGCGTSTVDDFLISEGYTRVTNTDFSEVLIENKKSRNPIGVYNIADVRDLHDYAAETFGCVLDKGTLDSLLSGSNAAKDVHKMILEVFRVLGKNGVFICFSYGQPSARFQIFEKVGQAWNVECRTISRNMDAATSVKPFYCYICRKK